MCSVVFLELPIQTLLSVASRLSVSARSGEKCENFSKMSTPKVMFRGGWVLGSGVDGGVATNVYWKKKESIGTRFYWYFDIVVGRGGLREWTTRYSSTELCGGGDIMKSSQKKF